MAGRPMRAFNCKENMLNAFKVEKQNIHGQKYEVEIFTLKPELALWLMERNESTTLHGGAYPALFIKDEIVALEFKLTWL
jgi:hypothetical protein